MNYHGVARDAAGNAISKQFLSLEFKIWQGNPGSGGSIIYSEVYSSVQTDTFGLYTLVIGKGTQTSSQSFNQIPWSAGNMWVEVYIDPANGTNFQLVSGAQLMSVPYALYAASSGSGGGGANINGIANNIPKINSTGNGIKNSLIYESADSSSIGINTSSPLPGAALDITSTSKGLLIPRMTGAQRGALSNLHHGLIVFQTDNPNILSPQGFWYYDASISTWLFLPPAQAVWTLAGNYGTTPGTHFIGTLDDKDVVFKTGTTSFAQFERMRMFSNSNGGNIQFGDPTNNKHYIFPAQIGNPGDILQLDPGGTNKLLWKAVSGGGGLWSAGIGSIFPNNLTDVVGIGTNTPLSTLDIFSSSNTNGALNVVNAGASGPAGTFTITNAGSGNVVLDVGTSGSGNAINATAGNGYALSGVAQGGSALWVQNSSTNQSTIDASSHGSALAGNFMNVSTGGAGNFQINNSSNTNTVLNVNTNGSGQGISVNTTTGTAIKTTATSGSALDANNAGGGNTINSTNSGTQGNAGNFQITNSANGNAALSATTNGGGEAIIGNNSGAGSGVYGNHSGTGTAVVGYNSGGGKAGSFAMVNATSISDALFVSTSSTSGGFSGNFVGGLGLKTDRFTMTNTSGTVGTVLTATNTAGAAVWAPLAGSINFSTPMSSTSQSFGPNNSISTATIILSTTPNYANGGVSLSGNAFTAPSAGIYHFDVQITISNSNSLSGGIVSLFLFDPGSASVLRQTQINAPASGGPTFVQPLIISTDLLLGAGQKVDLRFTNTSTGTNYTINNGVTFSWFNAHKVF